MEDLFNDPNIKVFKQVQYDLMDLKSNSTEEEIDLLIKKIPSNFLNEKENLLVICQMFSYYTRNCLHRNKGNGIKLFEKIMIHMKTYLQDESTFFWNIFGGLYYFKLWMHEEGLISIETIIQSIDSKTIEYFFPEIIEEEPELFEKEIKNQFKIEYSTEYLNEFKEKRKKYFIWCRNSNDYNDPLYKEIENNPLRLAIKTDDINSFQNLLSKSNIDINSEIEESIFDNFDRRNVKIPLVSFAIEYTAVKIFKYLIMNDVELNTRDAFRSIYQKNYEIIHIVESKIPEEFKNESFFCGISCWSEEIIEYSLDNYKYEFLEEIEKKEKEDDNIDNDNDDKFETNLRSMTHNTFFSTNFIFLESFFIPFFQKNQKFLKRNILKIINYSLVDDSCYFLKKLLKFQEIDINDYSFSKHKIPLITEAIRLKNNNAVEILLEQPNIDIYNRGAKFGSPIQFALYNCSDLKIIKLFCNHPKYNRNDSIFGSNSINICISKNNFYAFEYLINIYSDFVKRNFMSICSKCNGVNLKILLKWKLKNSTKKELIDEIECFPNDVQENVLKILDGFK